MNYQKLTWFLTLNQCLTLGSNQWSKTIWWCNQAYILRCMMIVDKVAEAIWEILNVIVIYQDLKTRVLLSDWVECLHSTRTRVEIQSGSRFYNRNRKRGEKFKRSGVGRMKQLCSYGRQERKQGRVRRKKRTWQQMKNLKGFNRLNEPNKNFYINFA